MENKNNESGKIIIVGDLFPVPSNFDLFSKGDVQTLFGQKICDLFASADYRICNLEGALTDADDVCEKTGAVIKAPTSVMPAFLSLGINCCTLANNHITDANARGVRDTIAVLEKNGIKNLGAGFSQDDIVRFVTFSVENKTFGLYNVAETMYNEPAIDKPGAFLYDEYLVCKELECHKNECDYLIVIYHGGAEKFRYPSPQIRKRFHRMVDSGANMILSQHTHCVGCEEYYKGSYLLYGQGNFLFRSFGDEFTKSGLILEIQFDNQGFVVRKHLVEACRNTVRYDEKQDFSLFNQRSQQVYDEKFVLDQFRHYCFGELPVYLTAFRGKNWLNNKYLKKCFPNLYKKYLLNHSYERKQMLLSLHALRSEQNREIAICGIKEWMNEN